MKKHSRIYAEIDLDAIMENFRHMRENIHPSTKIIAVVKTDGYGHGAVPIAKMMDHKPYIWGFAVATAEEAYDLREHQIHKPILILGYTFEEDYTGLIQNEIRPVVFKYDMAVQISREAERLGKTVPIHLAVDTGMTRIGFRDDRKSLETIKKIQNLPSIRIEGVFTHFARADEKDKSAANKQLERYLGFILELEKSGICIELKHCSNSAGILEMPGANLDAVRAGISIYGIYPSDDISRTRIFLRPAMSLKSHVVFIKEVDAGTPVSYGGTYVASGRMRIATIPVGYGDGYPRSLSNKGYVLIRGKKAPILGRICMDQFMVDVTEIKEVQELDEVVLMGNSEGTFLGVDELGYLSGRFPYEFVCGIGKRVPRIYKRKGLLAEPAE